MGTHESEKAEFNLCENTILSRTHRIHTRQGSGRCTVPTVIVLPNLCLAWDKMQQFEKKFCDLYFGLEIISSIFCKASSSVKSVILTYKPKPLFCNKSYRCESEVQNWLFRQSDEESASGKQHRKQREPSTFWRFLVVPQRVEGTALGLLDKLLRANLQNSK